ncbi:MAG: DUF58 domain-containing protein [Chromatiales bacterium]|nr:DUF58 domain-containing protein [Chromatiales bacterium]
MTTAVRPVNETGLQGRIAAWVLRNRKPAPREIRLDRRNIYILPTRYGMVYVATLFVMLLGATNYQNSMAFLLAFLLAGLGLNAMWHTHRSLAGLRVIRASTPPVFAGQTALFEYVVESDDGRLRPGLVASIGNDLPVAFRVPENAQGRFHLALPATRRGRLRPGRFQIYTRYPLGLFHAWSWLEFDQSALVYPRPLDSQREMPSGGGGQDGAARVGQDGEDFTGLREYRPGDTLKHIDWKALARTGDLLTREFTEARGHDIWLDYLALGGLDPETRLRVLCHWVLDAERRGLRYGLRLPGQSLDPAGGETHRDRCLERLALFGIGD